MSKKWYRKPVYLLLALALVLSLGIVAVPMAGRAEANGAPGEVWVAPPPDGNDTHDGTQEHPFATIQKGINETADDGTVHVAAGEYAGFYILERGGISVLGEEGTVVAGPITDVIGQIDETDIWPMAVIYESDSISIEGIDFEGPGAEDIFVWPESVAAPESSSGVLSCDTFGIAGEAFFDEIETDIVIGICSINSTASITNVGIYDMTSSYNMTSSLPAFGYRNPDIAITSPEYVGLGMVTLDGEADNSVNISESQIEDCLAGVLTLSLAPDTITISNTEIAESLAGILTISMAPNTISISGGKVEKCLAGMVITNNISPFYTVNISDMPVEECLAGMLIANEHINLNNCSITGLAESTLQEEFAPPEGEIPSYGLVALFGAEVDMLNCDISKCQGEWEIADGIQTGFGREIELPTGIPSVAVITDMDTSSVDMTGCTISDNDLGILAIPMMELLDEFGGDLLGFSDSIAGGFFSIDDFGWDGNGGSLLANMNNIAGNEYCGICNAHNETLVDATNNWWGSVNGPEWYPLEEIFTHPGVAPQFESASDNSGDIVVGNVTYEPWLGAPLEVPEAYHENLEEGEDQVVDASKEAGTTVTVTTTGATNITIARYESQPFPDEEFPDEALGKYIDIYISNPEVVTWPIHVELSYTDAEVAAAGLDESSLGLYYYQPEASFHRCSNTGANPTLNFIWANVTETEAGCLAGSPFGTGGQPRPVGGEAYPVNKVNLMLPWIALGMAIIAGATIPWRRRRARS